jgi:hypothetical protein
MAYQPLIEQKFKLVAHEEPDGKVRFYYYNIYKEGHPHNNRGWHDSGGYYVPKEPFESFVNSKVEWHKKYHTLKHHLSNDTIYVRGKTIHGPSWVFYEEGVEFEESDFPDGRMNYTNWVTLNGVAKHILPEVACSKCGNVHVKHKENGKLIYGNCNKNH